MLDKNDINSMIMAALRKLVHTCSQNEDDKKVMRHFAINCISRLFNVYVDSSDADKAAKSAAMETLKVSVIRFLYEIFYLD